MDHIKISYIKKCEENTGDDYNLKPMVRNFKSRSLLLSANCAQTLQVQVQNLHWRNDSYHSLRL